MVVTYALSLKYVPAVLVDARRITPDQFAGKKLDEIKKIVLLEGGREVRIGELFDIVGPERAPENPGDIEILLKQGSNKLCYLGYRMSGGRIVVEGDVGHFTGYKMRGGSIVVKGNTRNYTGSKMRGGTIEVLGDAGHKLGGKLQGEKPGKGMKGGKIIVHGRAGAEVGVGMRSGTIIIHGDAGNLVGVDMQGGTIVVVGNAGIYPGTNMYAGKIVIGGKVECLLPSFYADAILPSVKAKGIRFDKSFMLFIGDAIVGGRGLLYLSYEDNKALLEPYKELVEGMKL